MFEISINAKGGNNHTVGREKMHPKFRKHSQISEDSIWLRQMPNGFAMIVSAHIIYIYNNI